MFKSSFRQILSFVSGCCLLLLGAAVVRAQRIEISDAELPIVLPHSSPIDKESPKFSAATPLKIWRDAALNRAVVREANRFRIDPLLIHALITQESGGRPRARSHKGAVGLMQLMPGTGLRFGVRDRYSVNENVRGGVAYFVWLLDYFAGDVTLALAGYNSGEGAVVKYGRKIPPYRETQNYVRSIARRYRQLRATQNARAAP